MKEYSKAITLCFTYISKRSDEEKPKSTCSSNLLCPKLHDILTSKVSSGVVLLQSLPTYSFHVLWITWLFEEKLSLTSPP